mgnify:CR=1 FL=1|jgi:hypothetical protein
MTTSQFINVDIIIFILVLDTSDPKRQAFDMSISNAEEP